MEKVKIDVNKIKDYKELYEENIEHYNGLQKERLESYMLIDRLKKDIDLLFDDVEGLNAKNCELRRELDGVYKVLEMDACDIQKLQDKMEDK